MAKRFTVEAVFKGIDRFTAPITKMQNRVGKFSRGLKRFSTAAHGVTSSMVSGLKKVGAVALVTFGILGAGYAGVIRTAVEFEKNITAASAKLPNLKAGTSAYAAALANLSKEARRVGQVTEFTAGQTAQAMNVFITAGFNAEQATAGLMGAVNFATIAQMELEEATTLSAGALSTFGLKAKSGAVLAKNLSRVNDVLARTATSTQTTMEQLAETLKDGGIGAKLAGADIETFGALAGQMAEGMVKGSKAGVSIRNLFLRLVKPTGKAAQLLKRYNVQILDSKGNMKDIVGVLSQLDKGMQSLGKGQRTAALAEIFGVRGAAGIGVLFDQGIDKLRSYREVLRGATGAADEMAAKMRDNVGTRLKILKSAFEELKLKIADATAGPFTDLILKTTEWLKVNDKLIAQNVAGFIQTIIDNKDQILFWGKAILFTVGAIYALNAVLGVLNGVMIATNIIMAANPLVLVALAVIGVATAFFFLGKVIGKWLAQQELVMTSMKGVLMIATDIGRAFNWLGDKISGAFKSSLGWIDKILIKIQPIIDKIDKLQQIAGGGIVGAARSLHNFIAGNDQTAEPEAGSAPGEFQPQTISQTERISETIRTTATESRSTVTIKDETTNSQVEIDNWLAGLTLEKTGAF